MYKALFDWPIVLQYDVKAKYRLISMKFFGHKVFFHPSVRLTIPIKATRVCILSIGRLQMIKKTDSNLNSSLFY